MMPHLLSQPSRSRVLPVALAVLVAVLLAAGLAAVAFGAGEDRGGGRRPSSATGATAQAGAGSSASPDTPLTPPPMEKAALPHVPPAQRGALEELMTQVAEVRGLAWREPLQLRLVSRDEMVRRLRAANARDTDPAQVAVEEATLKLLGLIPPTLDLPRLIDEILRSAVLGFYDPETKELYVAVGDVNALDAGEKATIVHEMTHALTDQHFAYGPRNIALDKADKADESLALSALLEGDARLTETLWMAKHLDEVEALAVLLGLGAEVGDGLEVLARTPSYVKQALVFPYEAGQELVDKLHSAGGYAAVNAAYGRPPSSSEQILHPEAYTARESSTPPPLPDLAAATGCRRIRAGTLGEFDMRALLDQHAPGAAPAADGWNGDAYSLLRCGTALALADRWSTDQPADAGRLADALGRWAVKWSGGAAPRADGRFSGPSGAGRIVRTGSRVDLVLAQNAETADRVASALR